MSFGQDIDAPTNRGDRQKRKPVQCLADAQPGDLVRLQFGNVLVKVYRQDKNRTHTWVRWVNEADGTESEPEVLSSKWAGTREERE